MNLPIAFLTTFGLGYLRPAPGTWGSMPPAALAWVMLLAGASTAWMVGTLVVIAVVFTLACFGWGRVAEQKFGRKDPSHVVADETAGQAVALLPIPFLDAAMAGMDLPWPRFIHLAFVIGAAFVLFRIADIIKPPPARRLQDLPAGAGIVIDDLFAGAYAAIPFVIAALLV
ncbi:MAG: phosphatidylglycerophosphatase A [Planctomycetota bacterium]|nr:phosphatidylglycerophosphatase A [Planctomycetota bacterium]